MRPPYFAWLLAALAGPVQAAPIPGALVPGNMYDGLSSTMLDPNHTAYCLINPQIIGSPGQQSFATNGPSATAFQQLTIGGNILLTFPGLAEGVETISGGNTNAGYNYYSQGAAVLAFTGPGTGTISFLGSGNTVGNKNVQPSFNDFETGYDSQSGQLFVSFGIIMGPCAVAFRGAFQT